MNTKFKQLSLGLALALLLLTIPMPPQTQTAVWAADASKTTITVENQTFYDMLKDCLKDGNAAWDNATKTITFNAKNITYINIWKGVDMAKDNSGEILKTLLADCTSLKSLRLEDCNLNGFDLSVLNNRESLTGLCLVNAKIDKIPNIKLKNLKTLCLSKNNLSADGACGNLTSASFPALTTLWLDGCQLSTLDFIQNSGGGYHKPFISGQQAYRRFHRSAAWNEREQLV